MGLAPFFFRTYMAVGAHAGITRDQLETILSEQLVEVKVGERCVDEGNEKWIAELLVNLLARLYPVLCITGPEGPGNNLRKLARAINPEIEFDDSVGKTTVSVSIGAEECAENGFFASAGGWVARIGKDPANILSDAPANPYSSGAAAALAAWRVFDLIVMRKDPDTLQDVSLSLLDFSADAGASADIPCVHLGEVAVVGIGAVGNPAVWAWRRHQGLTGLLHLIDPEGVDLSNLQRYVLPHYKDHGQSKAQLAKREFLGTALSVEAWECALEDFADRYAGISTLPTICVSVDNATDRRAAQALLPRLIVNGWTSDGGLGSSWHRFSGDTSCLGCLYHPYGTRASQTEIAAKALGLPHLQLANLWVTEEGLGAAEIKVIEEHLHLNGKLEDWVGKRVHDVYTGVICGQIGIDLKSIGQIATVPLAHQSVLAGVLMAAELVKRSDETLESMSQTQPLVKWDQILAGLPVTWTAMRKAVPGCFCSDEHYQRIYEEKWNG